MASESKDLDMAVSLISEAIDLFQASKYDEAYEKYLQAYQVLSNIGKESRDFDYYRYLAQALGGLIITAPFEEKVEDVITWAEEFWKVMNKLYEYEKEREPELKEYSPMEYAKLYPLTFIVYEIRVEGLLFLNKREEALKVLDEFLGKEKPISIPIAGSFDLLLELASIQRRLMGIRANLIKEMTSPEIAEKDWLSLSEEEVRSIVEKYKELGYPEETALTEVNVVLSELKKERPSPS